MFKKLSVFLAAMLIFPLSAAAFDDISSSDKNISEINYIKETGIFGTENFYPEKELSRGDFVKYLLIASGISSEDLEGTTVSDYAGELREYGINAKLNKPGFEQSKSINLVGSLNLAMKWYGVPVPKIFDVDKFKKNTDGLSSSAFYAPVMARAIDLNLVNEEASPFKNLTRRDFAVMVANLEVFDAKVQTTTAKTPEVIMIDSKLLNNSNLFLSQEQYEIFEDIWTRILDEYVDSGEITEDELFYGAMTGLVETLDDPYSVFQEPLVQESFRQSLNNEVEGIGASVSFDELGRLVIVSPIVGSPAEKAGLLPNDIIKKINGKTTDNASLTELVNRIKGESGTDVNLTILRGSKTLEFTVTRAAVKVPALKFEVTSKNVAIVKINNFGLGVSNAFDNFVDQVDVSKLNGLIIDLRNNPGGYLEDAVEIADYFLASGDIIVQTVDASGKPKLTKATTGAPLGRLETVVLTNNGSASSSEILAAALRDNGKAKLIGETTFGKGSVQELVNYTDNSALKLTIARWLSPNGKKIDRVGINPDIVVKTTASDREIGNDPAMNRALKEF